MQFSLEKCAKFTFRNGSQVKSKDITQDKHTEITVLEHDKNYKYLGINEANGINQTITKKKTKEINRSIKVILRIELNAKKNKFVAINTLAIRQIVLI